MNHQFWVGHTVGHGWIPVTHMRLWPVIKLIRPNFKNKSYRYSFIHTYISKFITRNTVKQSSNHCDSLVTFTHTLIFLFLLVITGHKYIFMVIKLYNSVFYILSYTEMYCKLYYLYRYLRSASSTSRTRLSTVGDTAFLWNSLLSHVTAASLSIFCCRLKSHLFSLSYPAFWLFFHL